MGNFAELTHLVVMAVRICEPSLPVLIVLMYNKIERFNLFGAELWTHVKARAGQWLQ